MNQFTVTITFQDGYTSTRDLIDQYELNRYIASGVAMQLIANIQIINNFETKETVAKKVEKFFPKSMYGSAGSVYN